MENNNEIDSIIEQLKNDSVPSSIVLSENNNDDNRKGTYGYQSGH